MSRSQAMSGSSELAPRAISRRSGFSLGRPPSLPCVRVLLPSSVSFIIAMAGAARTAMLGSSARAGLSDRRMDIGLLNVWGCGGGWLADPAEKRVPGGVRRERCGGGAGGGAAVEAEAAAAAGVAGKKSLVRLGRLRREGVVVRALELDALASVHVPRASAPPEPDPAEC